MSTYVETSDGGKAPLAQNLCEAKVPLDVHLGLYDVGSVALESLPLDPSGVLPKVRCSLQMHVGEFFCERLGDLLRFRDTGYQQNDETSARSTDEREGGNALLSIIK